MQGDTFQVVTSHGTISVTTTVGEGAPLLLIHANSLCKECFGHQIETFAGVRRLIAIDLPGHGASSDALDPRRTYSLAGYADCAAEVLQKIRVDSAAVVGWSVGGHVGLEMTVRYPGLLGLMAIGTPPFTRVGDRLEGFRPHPRLAISGAGALSASEVKEFVTLVGDYYESDAEPFWYAAVARTHPIARQYMIEALLKDEPRRQRELAENCRVPLAMINGGADAFVDTDYVASLKYRNLWSGRTHVLDGCGHAPHVHAPHAFNQLLERFILDVQP
jgi:pimeloyl-ACP methyl ester carboxylesterase